MTVGPVSTLSLFNAPLQSIQQTQSALSNLGVESTTGQYADLGLQLGDQSGYELSLRNQNDLLSTLTASNAILTTNLTTTQSALDTIRQGAQSTLTKLTGWNAQGSSDVDPQSLGTTALQDMIAAANTTSDGQYLLSGQNTSAPSMLAYSSTSSGMTAIDQAFQATFGMSPTDSAASSISSGALQNFLSNQFASLFQGSNWNSDWSNASSLNSTAQISPGESADVTASATQAGLPQLTQAYAMLQTFAGAPFSQSAQETVVSTATSLISQGMSAATSAQASIGTVQQRITDANTAMASQQTILQTQLGSLDNVDAAQVATQLNMLSTQLETAYQLTAQLQKLSLAQYIPA